MFCLNIYSILISTRFKSLPEEKLQIFSKKYRIFFYISTCILFFRLWLKVNFYSTSCVTASAMWNSAIGKSVQVWKSTTKLYFQKHLCVVWKSLWRFFIRPLKANNEQCSKVHRTNEVWWKCWLYKRVSSFLDIRSMGFRANLDSTAKSDLSDRVKIKIVHLIYIIMTADLLGPIIF